MEKKIFRFLAGSILMLLLIYNVGIVSNATSVSVTLDFLSSQAIECSSECCSYPDCTAKMNCDGLCVEHSDYFQCDGTNYYCSIICES